MGARTDGPFPRWRSFPALFAGAARSRAIGRSILAAAECSLDGLFVLQSIRGSSEAVVDFRVLFANENAARLVGVRRERLIGHRLRGLMPQIVERGFFSSSRQVLESCLPHVQEFAVDGLDGVNAEWLKIQVVKLEDGVAVTCTDISDRKRMETNQAHQDRDERKRAEEESRRTHAFRDSLIESSPAAIIVTDSACVITAINPAAEKMLWYKPDELVGRATPLAFYESAEVETRTRRLSLELGEVISPEQAILAGGRARAAEHAGEWTFRRKTGSTVSVHATVTPLSGVEDETIGFMITAYDVSERKRREEQISHLAHHDALTGLPTRQLLMDRLSMMLSRSKRFGATSALLMIDLNNFKQVNDTFGHHVGDRLLVQVSERLRSAVRAMDTVARMGGDEFIVLVGDLESTASAELVAEKLLAAFRAPFSFGKQHRIEVTASIGVCVYPNGGGDADSLLKNADIAMYHAKATGRHSYQIFTDEIAELAVRQREMETALGGALAAGELELHYQPQFSLVDGSVVGVEALLRWNSRKFGAISPARFIPVAEESGLILPIGAWVIETACGELRKLQSQFGKQLVMAVNLSPRQLDPPDLLRVVERALTGNGLDPSCLEIEITEGLLMSDSARASAFFGGLRKLGVRVAIDDFGTGFSSMSYLLRFPVNRLKIDRCFIQDLSNPNGATVTSAIIALAHELHVSVVAEGVESQQQIDFLRQAGCDDAQGFHLCRPVSSDLIASSMTAQSTPA